MEDKDEPLSEKNHHQDRIIKSLFTPDRRNGENAIFNISIWPEKIPEYGYPVLARSQRRLENSKTGTSETVLKYLTSPTELLDFQETIMGTNDTYAKFGHEDTRIYKHENTYNLTSIAVDNINPRVVGHKTKNFKEIEPEGIIGPEILLEKAIKIVKPRSHYGFAWKRNLSESQLERKVQLLSIKDASKIYVPDKQGIYKPALIIRASPHIQMIIAENEDDFKRNDFWEHSIENIEENTILTKERHQAKIGIGNPPIKINGKYIGTYHIVSKEKQGEINIYRYYGSFYEFDPETRKIISRIREPLLHPTNEMAIVEQNIKGIVECIKFVDFPSAIIPDSKNDDLYTYIGNGDKVTDVYVTSIKWVCEQLDKKHNKKNLIDFSAFNSIQRKRKAA